ncbi:MAG TPA: VWA domain-containing protein [Pyrinomonadaceae bacterium]|nr:VWA domain-containing protein [Pyrinomonadaceae bacterium]
MNDGFVLEGLFLHLVRSGFPLGIRDYQDALSALRGGFGTGSRENLLWLCHTLWARTNEESRQLDLLFRRFPFPSDEQVRKIAGESIKQPEVEQLPKPATTGQPLPPTQPTKTPIQDRRSVPSAEIVSRNREEGMGLPRARVEPNYEEMFILARRPNVSLRALTIIWRRFRAARREGPRVELDLDATIDQQCCMGILESPVLVPARRNQAKLVLLMDVSNSMLPWQDFQRMIVESLQTSHLGQAAVYYFHNVPADVFYRRDTLTRPIPIEKVLKECSSSTLLVFSDAGAVRGFNRRQRVQESADFLAQVWRHWQPIVWMNPMPADRWKNSSAEKISQLSYASMLHLNEEGLVRAIDVLRGKPLKAN